MAVIVAVCSSREKGTPKEVIDCGLFKEELGLADDAHADCSTHRQVSLLARESIEKMVAIGLKVGPGSFAENLTTEGIDLPSLAVGTVLAVGNEVLLQITQIGKECHSGCAVFRQAGKCIMPREGVFARVVRGGPVMAGDTIQVGTVRND
jgi:MOSC domain-containing protein YiiM